MIRQAPSSVRTIRACRLARLALASLACTLSYASAGRADEPAHVAPSRGDGCEESAPWSRLGRSAANTLAPLPLALMGAAVSAPIIMAPTGVDHDLRVFSQRTLGGAPNLEPVSYWVPYLLPAVLAGVDLVAYGAGSCELVRPTSAMLQAVGMTLVWVGTLKWITGRTWPNAGRDPTLPDRLDHPEFARSFHPFSWRGGAAWPSGHTATMVAAAMALSTVTYGKPWVSYLVWTSAVGVAAGMWLGDHHWGSDIVSGALFGVTFGRSAGLAFRDDKSNSSSWLLVPFRTIDGPGAAGSPVVEGIGIAGRW